MKKRALVVDDDSELAGTIKDLLQSDGFQVRVAGNADQALRLLSDAGADVMILDVGLPGFSGIQLCRHLKSQAQTASLPILMLTSRSLERDKVQGLDSGADDYVTKPFSVAELRARVRALLRRSQGGGQLESVWTAQDLSLNEDTRTVLLRGKPLDLRPKEFELLALFLKKKGRVLSRQFLGEAVWGPDALATSHTINVSVSSLREKLGDVGERIVAVTGIGYKFEDPDG